VPVAVHAPFLLERTASDIELTLHVARPNPIHEVIAKAPDVLVTVAGPDAYVSPDWYVSAEQVPTWNYAAVHLTGVARIIPEASWEAHVTRLSDLFEERLRPKKPWTMDKVGERRKAMLMKGIVGIAVTVTKIDGAMKLSQNKTIEDRGSVAQELTWQGDWQGFAVARLMHETLK